MNISARGAEMVMKAGKMSMADLASGLKRQTRRPVEDRTGVKGEFDFELDSPDASGAPILTGAAGTAWVEIIAAWGYAEN